jgi:hypothetical protein
VDDGGICFCFELNRRAPTPIHDPTWVTRSCQQARRSAHSIGCPQPADSCSLDQPRPSSSSGAMAWASSAFMHDGDLLLRRANLAQRLAPSTTQRGSPGLASKHDDRLIRSDGLSNVTPAASTSVVPPSRAERGLGGDRARLRARGGHLILLGAIPRPAPGTIRKPSVGRLVLPMSRRSAHSI